MAPSLLIGHSLGGAAVLRAAEAIPSARAVATIGAPFDPSHVTENFASALPEIEAEGEGRRRSGRPAPSASGAPFVEDVSRTRLEAALASLGRALLILHSPTDETVGIENASGIFLAARHPKSFVTLDGADHLISQAGAAEYAAEVIAAWAGRYVDLEPPAPAARRARGRGARVRGGTRTAFCRTWPRGPSHHALADEPRSFGGTDRGMSPYGFLAAGPRRLHLHDDPPLRAAQGAGPSTTSPWR